MALLAAKTKELDDDIVWLLKGLLPRLRAVFRRFEIPAPDQEDLVQTALVAMLMKATLIRDREWWLLGAVRNECRMYWRKLRTRQDWAAAAARLEATRPLPSPSEIALRRHDVARALAQLSPRQRQLIYARYWLGCDAAEAAARLGYQPGSMKRTTNRCLRALRKAMSTDS